MSFKIYPKIHRLGKEEVEGILDFEVTLEEKIDGANTSIWIEDGVIHCGSRTQEKVGGFNGFVEFVQNDEAIGNLLTDHPDLRLYGEWLVRHTIAYNELAYKKFYLFDALLEYADGTEEWLHPNDVLHLAQDYNIPHPQVFYTGKTTEADIQQFVGKSNLGDKGEGVVIKSPDFVNKFGERVYAKVVTQAFKEDNAIVFGGNNKHSDTYWEMYVVNKYATLARVQKIMNKIQPTIDHKLDLPDIPRISSTCYHDMLTEEVWEISKKVPMLDFKALQRLATRKFVQIYKDLILGTVSVADERKANATNIQPIVSE